MHKKFLIIFTLLCAIFGLSMFSRWMGSNETPGKLPIAPFTEGQVCKAAAALLGPVKPSIVKLTEQYAEGEVIHTKFRQDGNWVRNRCRIDGDRIHYAYDFDFDYGPGRWRDHPEDEKLTFSVGGGILVIRNSHGKNYYSKAYKPSDF